MNLRKVLFALGTAALCTTAFTNAIARDVLRVGTEPTFAPFEYLDSATKTYAGYDMDLIRAVADKAGYDVEIINMGFDALIPALSSGTIDVIAAGVSITEERAKRVDFTTPYYTTGLSTTPYYTTGLSILVRKTDAGTLKTMKDLEGKRIAVQIGTTGAEKAKSISGAKVVSFNTTSDAFMDLAQGGCDAVILDRPVIAYFLKNQPRAAKRVQLQPGVEDAADFGFAVKKGNAELLQKLNAGLKAVNDSGEGKKIFEKYFAE